MNINVSSVSDKHRKQYRNCKSMLYILCLIQLILLLILFLEKEMFILALVGLMMYFILYQVFQFLALRRVMLIFGEGLEIKFTEEEIKLCENINGGIVKYNYLWDDINYIQYIETKSVKDIVLKKDYFGLLFVIDKNLLYNGLSMQQKKVGKFLKRSTILQGGFFVDFSKEHYIKIIEFIKDNNLKYYCK